LHFRLQNRSDFLLLLHLALLSLTPCAFIQMDCCSLLSANSITFSPARQQRLKVRFVSPRHLCSAPLSSVSMALLLAAGGVCCSDGALDQKQRVRIRSKFTSMGLTTKEASRDAVHFLKSYRSLTKHAPTSCVFFFVFVLRVSASVFISSLDRCFFRYFDRSDWDGAAPVCSGVSCGSKAVASCTHTGAC
jgi:hypothetical protein